MMIDKLLYLYYRLYIFNQAWYFNLGKYKKKSLFLDMITNEED